MGAPKLDPKAFKKVTPKTSEHKLTALKARVEMYATKLEEMMKDEGTSQ